MPRIPTFTPTLPLHEFVARYSAADVSERAGAQSHFNDLCAALGRPTPLQFDPKGEVFAFERGVRKIGGGQGFADVWLDGRFAWEYKKPGKSLAAAYAQLCLYRDDLKNPPLLVVCDTRRFEVHTAFPGTVKRVFGFELRDLLKPEPTPTCPLPPIEVINAAFDEPERLRPGLTTAQVTRDAAAAFALLSRSLEARGFDPQESAHFLIRVLFCLFAEDIRLLPADVFTTMVRSLSDEPALFADELRLLFRAMARGGSYGGKKVRRFNGGLFADDSVLPLSAADLATLSEVAGLDWRGVEPSIFGTLFERGLDPARRSQLGAHYTGAEDIELIVRPVVVEPLRREWADVRGRADVLVADAAAARELLRPGVSTPAREKGARRALTVAEAGLRSLLQGFADRLAAVRVLDPACGSGNFLYLALRHLLDLEKEVIAYASAAGLPGFFPSVSPEQMRGIEVNPYAHELAPVTIWIGYIQWLQENGFGQPEDPVLKRMDMIERRDALLAPAGEAAGFGKLAELAGPPELEEAEWPEAEFIVGNPPFLGDKKMRGELGDAYVGALRAAYEGRVPGGADLVCYWFEKARALIERGEVRRAGLICTNSIRKGKNGRVLARIKETGDIFLAYADRPWEGGDDAGVRVSVVGFDDGSESVRSLDGSRVGVINPDLTSRRVDVTGAAPLAENAGLVFLGMMKAGPFDINGAAAAGMLALPTNPNGRPNSDVVKRRLGGQDVAGRDRGGWVIDFVEKAEEEAALYEAPFEHVRRHVKPLRDANRDNHLRAHWWRHGRSRPALRAALEGRARCVVTPEVAKHRVFVWMPSDTVPDHTCHVFARDDDYFFGVLHSRVHEAWSLALCNFMGAGNDPRYNSSRVFGTFPMPWPPGQEPAGNPRVEAVAGAARELVEKRDWWLNPEGATEADLKKRTLTALYNERPAWLDMAHKRLDTAVFACYGWAERPEGLADDEILSRLLALNRGRAQKASLD